MSIEGARVWGRRAPNIIKFTRKLIKSQPCCKRVGNSNFCDLIVLSNNSWSIGQNAPPPTDDVSAHQCREDKGENAPPK